MDAEYQRILRLFFSRFCLLTRTELNAPSIDSHACLFFFTCTDLNRIPLWLCDHGFESSLWNE
jgi:hypothetical protein